MNVLLVYPKFLVTFWGWTDALKFLLKKAAFPPVGLLTVAAMLPKSWNLRLVDVNVHQLADRDILWADMVFVGGMITQKDSAKEVLSRCHELNRTVIMGGPILNEGYDDFPTVRHFLLGEVENTLAGFLVDLAARKAKRVYPRATFPDLSIGHVIPRWDLIHIADYVSMMIEFGRACPWRCDFCNVTLMNGRIPRTKLSEQVMAEVEAIFETGFPGPIFFASDNFISNKKRAKELLRLLVKWQRAHGYPFDFTAEVDITLAEDEELMLLMVQAGFNKVFLGLETSNKATLIEWNKLQNVYRLNGEDRDMIADVRKIQSFGLHPMSGFIIGSDHDDETIFESHRKFYLDAGIVFPMTGILSAMPGTAVTARYQKEGRLLEATTSGDNVDGSLNFVPLLMKPKVLTQGYKDLMRQIYSPGEYYKRICVFFSRYNAANRPPKKVRRAEIAAFLRSVLRIGILGGLKTSWYYWKTLALAVFKNPRAFSEAVTLQIYGAHFRKIAENL